MELLHGAVTSRVIEVFFDVHRELGHGFLESVYSKARHIALTDACVRVEREKAVNVYFRGSEIGIFRADLIVDSKVLIEIKASEALPAAAEAQALNYLKATDLEVALILHFGQKPKFVRRLLTNDRKGRAVSVCSV